MLLPKVVSSPHRHVSTQLQKTSKSSNSCRIARLLDTLYKLYKKAEPLFWFCALQDKKKIYYIVRMDMPTAMDAANRLSAIPTEMGPLQNEIQERRRTLNLLLRSVRTMDPARKEARIDAAKDKIRALQGKLEILQAEQHELILSLALFHAAPPN